MSLFLIATQKTPNADDEKATPTVVVTIKPSEEMKKSKGMLENWVWLCKTLVCPVSHQIGIRNVTFSLWLQSCKESANSIQLAVRNQEGGFCWMECTSDYRSVRFLLQSDGVLVLYLTGANWTE